MLIIWMISSTCCGKIEDWDHIDSAKGTRGLATRDWRIQLLTWVISTMY
jgi:hypothetical protein